MFSRTQFYIWSNEMVKNWVNYIVIYSNATHFMLKLGWFEPQLTRQGWEGGIFSIYCSYPATILISLNFVTTLHSTFTKNWAWRWTIFYSIPADNLLLAVCLHPSLSTCELIPCFRLHCYLLTMHSTPQVSAAVRQHGILWGWCSAEHNSIFEAMRWWKIEWII